MNIFELGFAASTVGGSIAGGFWGCATHGVPGAITGAIVGAISGFAFYFVLVLLLAIILQFTLGGPLLKPKSSTRKDSDG
jgi:hypothetical protein